MAKSKCWSPVSPSKRHICNGHPDENEEELNSEKDAKGVVVRDVVLLPLDAQLALELLQLVPLFVLLEDRVVDAAEGYEETLGPRDAVAEEVDAA